MLQSHEDNEHTWAFHWKGTFLIQEAELRSICKVMAQDLTWYTERNLPTMLWQFSSPCQPASMCQRQSYYGNCVTTIMLRQRSINVRQRLRMHNKDTGIKFSAYLLYEVYRIGRLGWKTADADREGIEDVTCAHLGEMTRTSLAGNLRLTSSLFWYLSYWIGRCLLSEDGGNTMRLY